MKTNKLAPSILSADYANFESELKKLDSSVQSTLTSM